MRTMRAVLVGVPGCTPPKKERPATVRLDQIPYPALRPGWVIVKTGYKFKCGSDDKRFRGYDGRTAERWAGWTTSEPTCHEFEGTVVEVGEGVDPIDPNRHFAIAPLVPCHACPQCQRGRFEQCSYQFIGSTIAGGFGEYVAVPRRNLFELADGISPMNGGLMEVTAVALQVLVTYGMVNDDGTPTANLPESVIVLGAGIIGLITCQILRHLGVKVIMMAHTTPGRREIALANGATHYNAASEQPIVDVKNELFGPRDGFELVIEAAGTTRAMSSAVMTVGSHGKIWWLGTATEDFALTTGLQQVLMRRRAQQTHAFMSHTGVWPGREWHIAAKLMASGAINPASLVDGLCTWDSVSDVINAHLSGDHKPLKIGIAP